MANSQSIPCSVSIVSSHAIRSVRVLCDDQHRWSPATSKFSTIKCNNKQGSIQWSWFFHDAHSADSAIIPVLSSTATTSHACAHVSTDTAAIHDVSIRAATVEQTEPSFVQCKLFVSTSATSRLARGRPRPRANDAFFLGYISQSLSGTCSAICWCSEKGISCCSHLCCFPGIEATNAKILFFPGLTFLIRTRVLTSTICSQWFIVPLFLEYMVVRARQNRHIVEQSHTTYSRRCSESISPTQSIDQSNKSNRADQSQYSIDVSRGGCESSEPILLIRRTRTFACTVAFPQSGSGNRPILKWIWKKGECAAFGAKLVYLFFSELLHWLIYSLFDVSIHIRRTSILFLKAHETNSGYSLSSLFCPLSPCFSRTHNPLSVHSRSTNSGILVFSLVFVFSFFSH